MSLKEKAAAIKAEVIIPDPPPTAPSPSSFKPASNKLEVDPVIVQLQADNERLGKRVAELYDCLSDISKNGLNYTKIHTVLNK